MISVLNETIVEDATLAWFGELDYDIVHTNNNFLGCSAIAWLNHLPNIVS
jgi:hypothetical protein